MLRDMFKKIMYTKDRHQIPRPRKRSGRKNRKRNRGFRRECGESAISVAKPIYVEDVRKNFYVCPKCGGYFRVHAWTAGSRWSLDDGTFEEWDREMEVSNPLDFPGYEKKLEAAREKTRLQRGHRHRHAERSEAVWR